MAAIRPATIADVYELAANLRPQDLAELKRLGLNPKKAIRTSFRSSIWVRSAFENEELAAMWGLGGSMLSDEGHPWLLTTHAFQDAFDRSPKSLLRDARKQVQDMLAAKARLSNVVDASYCGACRLLDALGFQIDPPEPFGPNGVLFSRFWMTR